MDILVKIKKGLFVAVPALTISKYSVAAFLAGDCLMSSTYNASSCPEHVICIFAVCYEFEVIYVVIGSIAVFVVYQ